MPAIRYKVSLSEDEKQHLQALIHKSTSAARSQTRARILLKAAEGVQDKAIIETLGVAPSMVANTRQRRVKEGPEAALRRKAMTTGPCGYWRARWWSWLMHHRAVTKPSISF